MSVRVRNFVGGKFLESDSEGIDLREPATGRVVGSVPDSSPAEVDRAVEVAREAFPGWSRTPASERSAILLRLADRIEENLDELASLESRDTGKPIALASTLDIPRAVANFRFFATAILHDSTEAHQTDGVALNYTRRQPVGVAGLISPWNLPLYLLTWKIAPALATGNCCVAKPSELTPLSAERLGELANEAGLPPGVMNIVHGSGPLTGSAITAHPDIPLISFTGGTSTGETVARTAAPLFKRLSLELGGKNPNLIFDDADLADAIEGSVRASFSNQGEICLCGSRILVQRSIYDRFVSDFVERVERLVVGDPANPETDVGALISEEHRSKVERYVALAVEEGGRIVTGGGRRSLGGSLRDGYFFEPTVVTGTRPGCRVFEEEIFGPLVTITPFEDEDEAVELANAVRYGLSASVWTNQLERAHRVAAAIEAGTVWVNTWLLRDLRVPFGGVKASGVGREGGRWSLDFFTEAKNVCIRL